MSKSMKDSWKDTGSDLGHAFKGLGKNIIRSGKTGVDKACGWAEEDDYSAPVQQPYNQPPQPQYHAPFQGQQQNNVPQYQPPRPVQQSPQQPSHQYQPPKPAQPNYNYDPNNNNK